MSDKPKDYREFAVLYVDDEEQALKYFRKFLNTQFRVLIAPSVDQALEILNREGATIGVMVTDQKMPGKCGTELLIEVRKKWPHIVRIMLTAYSDMDSAVEAVNGGAIYKYLNKPVDFDKLSQTLIAAMDVFLAQHDRDSLMQEKMGMLRRMIVSDRVRSMAELAHGITHHLRNSMTAMNVFLEEAQDSTTQTPGPSQPNDAKVRAAIGNGEYLNELLSLATQERDGLLKMVEKVQQSIIEPTGKFPDDIAPDALIQCALQAVKNPPANLLKTEIAPGLPTMKLDRELAVQMFQTLISYTARLCPKDSPVSISAKNTVQLWGASALQIFIGGQGPDWQDKDVAFFFTPFAFPKDDPSDLGMALVIAFFIAYHHGGDLLVHKSSPNGPGFELLLPFDPAKVTRPAWQDSLIEDAFLKYNGSAAQPVPTENAA
jgi:two-component system probable response regulator PhcQ